MKRSNINTCIRMWTAWILALLLTASALAQPPAASAISAFDVGASVKIRVAGGRQIEGTIESKGAQDFSIRTTGGSSVRLPYADVLSAEAVKQKRSGGKAKWIVLAAVVGAAVIIGGIFAARAKNEGAF